MSNKLVALTLFCSLFFSNASFAEAKDKKSHADIAANIGKCSGLYQSMSDVLTAIDRKNAAKTFEDTGRGAYFAAAWLSYISENIPNWDNALAWAEAQQETNKNYWNGLLELHTSTEKDPFPDDFMTELKFCTSLNPVQTELVTQMREFLYSQKEPLETNVNDSNQ